ncbi:MAG: cell division protein FtsQ/DivIB [Gammaproteobacteria bacterium]|nr:cell division protein FtsQ/DivIB [Gammaproteobacteria bacterium]
MLVTFSVSFFVFLSKEVWPFFPINKVQIFAPMRFVTEQEVEDLLTKADISKVNFFYLDMARIKLGLKQNYWIDDIKIARVWPDQLRIKFDEHEPLAYWNNNGIMTRQTCEIIPLDNNLKNNKLETNLARLSGANLPKLVGKEENSKKLCDILEKLKISIKPIDIEIKKLSLSNRGSWYLELTNGLIILLGKKDILNRTDLFVSFFLKLKELKKTSITSFEDNKIAYIDMRYNNGLAVGAVIKTSLNELVETA